MVSYNEVLFFWYLQPQDSEDYISERSRQWFGGGAPFDEQIRERFSESHAQAAAGQLDTWADFPKGRAALIILLDQFSRNLHRSSPEAFATDDKAQDLCLDGLKLGHDLKLSPLERVFFYMPLMHSESLEQHDLSIEKFNQLTSEGPLSYRATFESFLDYAHRHRDIIRRFGRYPHRNEVLQRPSTAEEEHFLTQPGSSF